MSAPTTPASGNSEQPCSEVELFFWQPDVAPGTVVGTVELIADLPQHRVTTVVRSSESVRVSMPSALGYSAQGRLTSGDRLTGYAIADASGKGIHMELTTVSSNRAPRLRPSFTEAPWVAGWAWDAKACKFQPDESVGREKAPGGVPILTGGKPESTGLIQVSADGGPAYFVLRPPGESMWVTEDRPQPAPGLAATLLDLLHRCNLDAAHQVVSQALGADESLSPRALLDLAIGYYFVHAEDQRLREWAAHLTRKYAWSADAHVITAQSCLRHSDSALGHAAAEQVHAAVERGLPVITQGLQLLIDSLALVCPDESRLHGAVLPYATCARTDTVLTTFWGEHPETPQTVPILVRRPLHAMPLDTSAKLEDSPPGPIAVQVGMLSARSTNMPPQLKRALGVILLSLRESVRLSSRLSAARTAADARELSRQLEEALVHGERTASTLASAIDIAAVVGRSPGAISHRREDQAVLVGTARALEQGKRDLRRNVERLRRAQTTKDTNEGAQRYALSRMIALAAQLAADTRDAADALAQVGIVAIAPQALSAPQDPAFPVRPQAPGPILPPRRTS